MGITIKDPVKATEKELDLQANADLVRGRGEDWGISSGLPQR
jgi:hypothetical protein